MTRLPAALAALALSACATAPAAPSPAPSPTWRPVAVQAAPAALNAPLYEGGAGPIVFAGAVALSSGDPAFRGFSDLKLTSDGRIFAVTNGGALLQAKLTLDARSRLTGLSDAFLRPLVDLQNRALTGADAESLAILPDGRLLIGFEGEHRIWVYDASGAAPAWAPNPARDLPADAGLKALSVAAQPERGPKGRYDYLAAVAGGRLWRCAFDNVCNQALIRGEEDPAFVLAALDVFDREEDAYVAVWRAHDEVRGVRIRAKVLRQPFTRTGDLQVEPLLELNASNAVGQIEGVAVDAPRPDGSRRLYLLGNAGESARTLLLAFDVR